MVSSALGLPLTLTHKVHKANDMIILVCLDETEDDPIDEEDSPLRAGT